MAICRDCQQSIFFAKTPAGKSMPLDPEPHPKGNVLLHADGTCTVVGVSRRDEIPLEVRYLPHWDSCPVKNAARNAKGSGRGAQPPENMPGSFQPASQAERDRAETVRRAQAELPLPGRPTMPEAPDDDRKIGLLNLMRENESAALALAVLQAQSLAVACENCAGLASSIGSNHMTADDKHRAIQQADFALQQLEHGIKAIRTIFGVAADAINGYVALSADPREDTTTH